MSFSSFNYWLFFITSCFLLISIIGKKIVQWRHDNKIYQAVKCRHQTKKKGKISFSKKSVTLEMPVNKDGTVDYCLDCLAKMSIKCAWCGEPIFIGDPVTLYAPRDQKYQPPEKKYAIYSKNPLRLVGCLRSNCAESGADRSGFWLPPGKVCRVLSPIEQCMHQNDVVVINDLSDPKEAIFAKEE